jgi:hypothetical protein
VGAAGAAVLDFLDVVKKVATRSAELFIGLGLVEGLCVLPDLATAIVVGVHLFQAAGTRLVVSKNVTRPISV